ncbi:hypothetical protein H0E87_013016 [Populus deltoides]|uniref:Uncharacterized protein n=1 Tax=Populus deltoides TaxID=3696 RepID=A0A8T2YLX8_POPDE|nr:hypothetical protein H0E87_013016 [Populus deltoides]
MVRMQDCSWLRTKEVPVQLLILEARSCSPYMSLEDLSDYSDNSSTPPKKNPLLSASNYRLSFEAYNLYPAPYKAASLVSLLVATPSPDIILALFHNWISKIMNFRSLEEFWSFYVIQHSKPSTRRWHFVGTLSSILLLLYSLVFNLWFLFFVPLVGYGFAWYSHFFVEGNIPASYGHPVWSFQCDCKMFGLMLTGQMDREIKRLGKRPILQGF